MNDHDRIAVQHAVDEIDRLQRENDMLSAAVEEQIELLRTVRDDLRRIVSYDGATMRPIVASIADRIHAALGGDVPTDFRAKVRAAIERS